MYLKISDKVMYNYLKEVKELQPFVSKLRPFHFTIVDGKNECLYWLERAWGTTS